MVWGYAGELQKKPERTDHVLMYSGGLDSFIAYWYLKFEMGIDPTLVYAALGHRYQYQEMERFIDHQKIIGKPIHIDYSLSLGHVEEPDAYIPLRNSFLAHVGSFYADNVWLITQKGETMLGDRSLRGFQLMSETMTHLYDDGRTITVNTPFWDMTKVDMVSWFKEKGLPTDWLLRTHSCYYSQSFAKVKTFNGYHSHVEQRYIPCGQCSACFRRWVAFELNDISEEYDVDPWSTDLAQSYLKKAKEGYYGWGRDEEIIAALEKKGVTLNDNQGIGDKEIGGY